MQLAILYVCVHKDALHYSTELTPLGESMRRDQGSPDAEIAARAAGVWAVCEMALMVVYGLVAALAAHRYTATGRDGMEPYPQNLGSLSSQMLDGYQRQMSIMVSRLEVIDYGVNTPEAEAAAAILPNSISLTPGLYLSDRAKGPFLENLKQTIRAVHAREHDAPPGNLAEKADHRHVLLIMTLTKIPQKHGFRLNCIFLQDGAVLLFPQNDPKVHSGYINSVIQDVYVTKEAYHRALTLRTADFLFLASTQTMDLEAWTRFVNKDSGVDVICEHASAFIDGEYTRGYILHFSMRDPSAAKLREWLPIGFRCTRMLYLERLRADKPALDIAVD